MRRRPSDTVCCARNGSTKRSPLLRDGYEGLQASKETAPEDTRAVRASLVELYESSGRPDQAARYRAVERAAGR
jgi:hypothetical protein